jgi:hypothetical protein
MSSSFTRIVALLCIAFSGFACAQKAPAPASENSPIQGNPVTPSAQLEQSYRNCPKGHYAGPRPGRNSYAPDEFIWAVTSKFAKDYCMPAEFIDDELEGAHAIAYRAAPDNQVRCSLREGKESCSSLTELELVVYVDTEVLPRKNPAIRSYELTDYPTDFLIRTNEGISALIKRHQESNEPKYPFEFDGLGLVAFNEKTKEFFGSYKELGARKVQATSFPGIDVVVLRGRGGKPGQFDESLTRGAELRVVFPKANVRFERQDIKLSEYGHSIKLPRAFMLRMLKHDDSYNVLPFSEKPRKPTGKP